MPAKSESQAKFMRFCAHAKNPPKRCPPKKVAREFMFTANNKRANKVKFY